MEGDLVDVRDLSPAGGRTEVAWILAGEVAGRAYGFDPHRLVLEAVK